MKRRAPRLDIYRAADGWRWRMVAANGRVLASGESHPSKRNAERAARTVLATAEVIAHADRKARWAGARA